MLKPTTKTASKVKVQTSKFQHRCHNTDFTLKTTKPTKTPKIPNRQKSQKPPKTSAKNFRAEKKSQQKFPHQKFLTQIL
jgi:hypothetical protein